MQEMLADRDEILLEYQNATRNMDAKREKLDKSKGPSRKAHEKELDDAQKKVDELWENK